MLIGPEYTERRGKFFTQVFRHHEGFLCITRKPQDSNAMLERYFEYPNQLNEALAFIEKYLGKYHIYFCAQLLSARQRVKTNVETVPHLWADVDYCPPEALRVEPSILIETSPERTQAIWRLDEALSAHEAEALSHRIALYHKDDGVDQSGWDLTQLLRVPWTLNFKYGTDEHPIVHVVKVKTGYYRVDDFKVYEPLPGEVVGKNGDVPSGLPTGQEVIERNRYRLSDSVIKLFVQEPDSSQKEGWSGALWGLLTQLAEAGLSTTEMLSVAQDAACNKYARDGRPLEALWRDVRKAYAMVAQRTETILAATPTPTDLLPEGYKAPESFIERYIAWAKAQTDAAEIYHQAGAFMMLSAALSGMIVLPTSNKSVKGERLNLWFFIMADTTITRKTTAMNMAIDMLSEVVSDAVVANEATIEGLLVSMAARSGKPSIFLRDEFSGMLDMIQRKDYYAGMSELLTQLYDGRTIARQLAKSSITVTDPLLIMFVGATRKVLELLDDRNIRSGFLPRFLYFSATSDLNNFRPLGPPTEESDETRDRVVEELRTIVTKYQTLESRKVGGATFPATQKIWKAYLTPDAWAAYNALERKLTEDGIASREPDVVTPMYQRLAVSILKAAVLLAAARPENPEDNVKVIVTVEDIEHAISFGIDWRASAIDVITSAGSSAYESQLKRIMAYIGSRQMHGATRSSMMRIFHLTSKDAELAFATLEARGVVRKIRQENEWIYFPTGI